MGQVIGPLFESMGRAAAELCEQYTTEGSPSSAT
jgi:hypothetical protein